MNFIGTNSNNARSINADEVRFNSENVDHDNVDNDEEDDGDEWDEVDAEQEPASCLFCDVTSKSFELAIEHLGVHHDINLNALKHRFALDQYSYIKVRTRNCYIY